MKKYRTIKWEDHFSADQWQSKKEIEKWAKIISVCTTVGEVTYEDDKVIVLSASHDGGENYGEHMAILKKNIVK